MNIGQMIYEQRKSKRLRQEDVAQYLHVSKSTLSNYENNIHEPDLDTLVSLADFFDVSTDYLLGRTNLSCNFSMINQSLTDRVTFASLIEQTSHLTSRELQYLLYTYELLSRPKESL
ncbi:MAG: helix-turn-helix transcriptional regulator [Lachnospiraceae bacterium]|nr:helix-turn-helix transcriptional regulator [Lachnospiraceae bacterium]